MQKDITYSELVEKLENLEITEEEIDRYFSETSDRSKPFSPQFELNAEAVELPTDLEAEIALEGAVLDTIVGLLNRYYSRKRQRAYERRINRGWDGLRFVAEGDSWFQYPLRKNDDLIDFLTDKHAIYCMSAAGDEFGNMLSERNVERITEALRNTEAHGLLFSAGGNDIAGDEFINFVENASGSNDPSDFITAEFENLLNEITDRHRQFLGQLMGIFPQIRIFCHGYDKAIPVSDGSWLGPSLSKQNIPKGMWAGIVAMMIDRYNDALAGLSNEFPGNFFHVNCIGAIGAPDEWRDELHSKPPGCERAAQRYHDAIDAVWPDSALETAALESGVSSGVSVEDSLKEAADAPSENDLVEDFELENGFVPDEPISYEDMFDLDEVPMEDGALEDATAPAIPYWPNNDSNSPEYSHLVGAQRDIVFDFKAADLELLINANHFRPKGIGGLLAFALRGAELVGGHEVEDVETVRLKNVRPNHFTYKCVLGFWNHTNGKISAYTGSTVPNARMVKAYYKYMNGLQPNKAFANLLPTGCYVFRRASHGWDKAAEKWKVPVALRLTNPSVVSDATATVLRTSNDMAFGTSDKWDKCIPYDNLHPAFSTTAFSSAGCLTVRGSNEKYTTNASGQWRKFLDKILQMPKQGTIGLVLLTGAEASIASEMRLSGASQSADEVRTKLERLRVGSSGDAVKKLQTTLGATADGSFGPDTKVMLTQRQAAIGNAGKANGVYSPELNGEFGAEIL